MNLYAILDQKCLFKEHFGAWGDGNTAHGHGQAFESDMVRHLCEMFGVKKTHTTSYNLKSDGTVERFNRTPVDQLVKTLLPCEGEWDSSCQKSCLATISAFIPVQGSHSFSSLTSGRPPRGCGVRSVGAV